MLPQRAASKHGTPSQPSPSPKRAQLSPEEVPKTEARGKQERRRAAADALDTGDIEEAEEFATKILSPTGSLDAPILDDHCSLPRPASLDAGLDTLPEQVPQERGRSLSSRSFDGTGGLDNELRAAAPGALSCGGRLRRALAGCGDQPQQTVAEAAEEKQGEWKEKQRPPANARLLDVLFRGSRARSAPERQHAATADRLAKMLGGAPQETKKVGGGAADAAGDRFALKRYASAPGSRRQSIGLRRESRGIFFCGNLVP